MDYNNLCFRCFTEKSSKEMSCPNCGYNNSTPPVSRNCLKPGSILNGRYIVGVAIGVGGFGITYRSYDTRIGGICAIKEYFPSSFCYRVQDGKRVAVSNENLQKYNHIIQRFVEEAKLLKTFHHKNVISVYDIFFENETAYYAMEYCNGIDLRKYTNNFRKKLEYNEGLNILYQVMNGLEYIHDLGVLHRDIAPDNIYITKQNIVKILDFGSARREMDQLNKDFSVIIKVGYAPIEQYGGREKQGSYTDIYALGATFYHLFTSVVPVESTNRIMEDKLIPFSQLRPDLPDNIKYCIEKAMSVTISNRIKDIREMKEILGLQDSVTQIPKISNRPQTMPQKVSLDNQYPINESNVTVEDEKKSIESLIGFVLCVAMIAVVIAIFLFFNFYYS